MRVNKDLAGDESKAVARDVVAEKLPELLADPDVGLSLQPETETRLRKQLENPQLDGANISAAEVARRLGLEW